MEQLFYRDSYLANVPAQLRSWMDKRGAPSAQLLDNVLALTRACSEYDRYSDVVRHDFSMLNEVLELIKTGGNASVSCGD